MVLLLLSTSACQKEAGFGGTCTLLGKLKIQDFNSQGNLVSEYYAYDERVFIIYGDDVVYNDEFRTHHDGTFRFEHLYKGDYTVFAYSKCDTCASPEVPVMATVTFTKEKEEVILADILVRR